VGFSLWWGESPREPCSPTIGSWCRSSTITLVTLAALNSKLSTINCLIITREYDRSDLKENGTIPFYRRFFDRINKIQKLQARIHSMPLLQLNSDFTFARKARGFED
jgi:hypothetical protein